MCECALGASNVALYLRGQADDWRPISVSGELLGDPQTAQRLIDWLPKDDTWYVGDARELSLGDGLDAAIAASPTRFLASAPLCVPGEPAPVGVLIIAGEEARRHFGDRERQFLADMADSIVERLELQLARQNAVENARRHDELRARVARRERQFQTLIDLLPLFVIVKDDQGNTLLSNRAHARACGLTPEQIIGRNYRDYVGPPEVAERMAVADRRVLQTGHALRTEREVLLDGNPRTVDVIKVKFEDWEPGVDAVLGVVVDISERKRDERELADKSAELERTIAELQRSNRELAQFAYVASHDLQEPLRMVTSFLSLLAAEYADALDADAQEYIGYAVDGARRMKAMIDALLSYSRMGSSGQPDRVVDLARLVDQAIVDVQSAHDDIDVDITCEALPPVVGRSDQLARLFTNLLSNAVKYRGDEPARIAVRCHLDQDDCVIAVADNGIGIPADQQERIFDIFVRGAHTRAVEGTGIGLAICRKIVEEHGGRIWVESAGTGGSTFYLRLPAHAASEDAP